MSGVLSRISTKGLERNSVRACRFALARDPSSNAPSSSPRTVAGMSKASAEASMSSNSGFPPLICEYAEVSITRRFTRSPPQRIVDHALRGHGLLDLRQFLSGPSGIARQQFAPGIDADSVTQDLQHRGVHAVTALSAQ